MVSMIIPSFIFTRNNGMYVRLFDIFGILSELCESATRLMESLSRLIRDTRLGLGVSVVEVELAAGESKDFNVSSVPSIRWFDGDKSPPSIYSGDLTPNGLISWISRFIEGSQPIYVSHTRNIQQVFFPWFVFGCFMDSDADGIADFFHLSSMIGDMGFVYSTELSVCSALNSTNHYSSISVCTKTDRAYDCSSSVSLSSPDALISSVYRLRLPGVLDLSSDPFAVQAILNSRSPFFIRAHTDGLTDTDLIYLGRQARELGASFGVVDAREAKKHTVVQRFLTLIGIGSLANTCQLWYIVPVNSDFHTGGIRRYRSDDCSTTLQEMRGMVRGGKIQEYLRVNNSDNTLDSKVRVIRGGADFLSTVTSSEYSIVLHYVPWCEKCFHLMEQLQRIAKDADPRILVGAIDCSVNDPPVKFRMTKFPQLVFYRADSTGKLTTTWPYDARHGSLDEWFHGMVGK